MVISKCVPLEISRKRFSQFLEADNPSEMLFVGWKYNEEGKKVNVQMKYEDIESHIIKSVKADPEWGQGGGGDTPVIPDQPIEEEVRNSAITITCGFEFVTDDNGNPLEDEYGNPVPVRDENGEVIIKPNEETWNEEAQTNLVNLGNKKGFVEINGGGNYIEDYIMFAHPIVGSVTHVVVDNTGLPLPNPAGREDVIGETFEAPKEDFVLYYGRKTEDYSEAIEIFRVPPEHRGVVQILHTEETDLILYSSYSWVDVSTKFVRDIIDKDNVTNDPIDYTPGGNNDGTKFYIDMDNYKGYIEFPTGDREECTFIFSNPEIGSNTFIVIDNTDDNYYGYPVTINYGKTMNDGNDENGKEPDWIEEITFIENEKCIIEVFHSLSADIIVKITKV